MQLELSVWTHHLTQLVYSCFYFCKVENIKLKIVLNKEVPYNGAILVTNNQRFFFDYSDNPKFIDLSDNYNFYFKRSLLPEDISETIYPLNFNVPMSYKSYSLLTKLHKDFITHKPNRIEMLRALDKFGWFTNSSHGILDINKYPDKVKECNGSVIFHTRLWNPDNHPDIEEKKRRTLQNEFRINACRIIKKNFKNVSVGLFPDDLSRKIASDILLDKSLYNKKRYLNRLKNYNIGIADDGLIDTPGWKIGEYILYGKAIISTPINVCVNNFNETVNYERLSSRLAYEELPDKIENLLMDKKYLKMGDNNFKWGKKYLHPVNYLNRILSIVKYEGNK